MLSRLGRPEDALKHAKEALSIYRKLAKADLVDFLSDHATSLNNLAILLTDLGQPEGALEHAREALLIRRTLAEARPEAFLSYLAMSLNTMSNVLSDLGQPEGALEHARESGTALNGSCLNRVNAIGGRS